MNLLFVCTGNTCRSPLAEAMARAAAERGRMAADCRSAGIATRGGAPPSEGSVEAARLRGLDLTGHRSRPLSDELLDWADLVVCMGSSHARAIPVGPGSPAVCLLNQFLDSDHPRRDTDVADPFGGSRAAYERAACEIEEGVEALMAALSVDRERS